jgi:predicted AAA+ superfamily ATPase
MLLPEDIHPENSLYFNGAYVLEALRRVGETSLLDLFIESRKLREMQMPIFVLTLDWLFLAGLVSCNANGDVESCS